MNTIDAAIRRIRAYAAAEKLTASGLALRAGLSANALRGFHRADWKPRLDTLRQIETIIPEEFQIPVASEQRHGACEAA